MDDLKPCPFCGGEDVEILPDGFGNWLVGCVTCEYRIQCVDCTKGEAIRYWNTRPAEDTLKKEITEQAANYENILCDYRNTIKEAVEQNDALKAEVERLKAEIERLEEDLMYIEEKANSMPENAHEILADIIEIARNNGRLMQKEKGLEE